MNDRTNNRESGRSTESLPAGSPTIPLRIVELARERRALIVGIGVVALLLVVGAIYLATRTLPPAAKPSKAVAEEGHTDEHGEEGGEGGEVELSPEALVAAKIEIEGVTERSVVAPLRATGAVEPNAEQTQQVTPLVSGRVERVHAAVGDYVSAGAVLAVISSPDVAEIVGKLREAETRLALAKRNVERVRRAENRAGVLSAKARLDEAEATLRRAKKLVELGVGAGKDLISAETMHATAKAEYDYQTNIAVNREVQEAQAEVETATTEVNHLRESIRSLGGGGGDGSNISQVTLRAPNSGRVTERLVNVGAGVQAGSAMFTIGNLSSMWVIARVPESQVGLLRTGSPASVRTAGPGAEPINGSINYIDPALDEGTRTARVRVEVPNPGERLKSGMFVEVDFHGASGEPDERELVVPASAVQRVGERNVVFLAHDDEPGHFEVRDVELGGEVDGYRHVISGLAVGDKVVTSGSFTLKTQLMKGEMGEHGH